MKPSLLLLVALVTVGCPSEEAPPPGISAVAGDYNIALVLLDNECVGFDYPDLMAFTLENNSARSMSLALAQEGAILTGVIGPDVACELTGTAGTSGTWNLSGGCDDPSMDRDLRIAATSTPYGDGLDLAGTLVLEIDGDPAAPDGADGEVDCVVEHRMQGSGTP